VLQRRDGPLFLEPDFRPLLLGEHWPRQPAHVHGEVVNAPQEDIGGHGAGVEHAQEVLGVGLQDREVADEVEGLVLHGPLLADAGGAGLGPGHFVHRGLPGAGGDGGVGGCEVGAGDLEVEDRLANGFVLRVEERLRFGLVLGSEADLFAGGRVFGIEDAVAPEQGEPLIHNDAFHVLHRYLVRHYRVRP